MKDWRVIRVQDEGGDELPSLDFAKTWRRRGRKPVRRTFHYFYFLYFKDELTMLVLSRRIDETISLPDLGITIKVVKVKGKTVSVGIEAPDQFQILRGELVESATSFNDSPPIPVHPIQCVSCATSTTTV